MSFDVALKLNSPSRKARRAAVREFDVDSWRIFIVSVRLFKLQMPITGVQTDLKT